MDVIDAAGNAALIDEAAQIWAEATAARDGRAEVAELEDSRPIIQGVLDRSARAILLLARSDDGTACGFAAIEPVAGPSEAIAEVTYFGVSPVWWGRGIGEMVLQEARRRLADTGYASVELSVYVHNQRAVALYERLGWRPVGLPSPHPRTGKPEQRYTLHL